MLEIVCVCVCVCVCMCVSHPWTEAAETHVDIAVRGCWVPALHRVGVGIWHHWRSLPRKVSFWIAEGGFSQRHGKGVPLIGKRDFNQTLCYKEEYTLATQPSNYVSRYLIDRNENIYLYKGLHMNACSSFIHNSLKLDTTQISLKRMNEQIMVYLYNGIPLNKKKEWPINTSNDMDESQNNYAVWKKPKKKVYGIWFQLYNTL